MIIKKKKHILFCKSQFQMAICMCSFSDARLQQLPFISVEFVLITVTLYLLFVLKWGPKFMEKRKPYNIERLLLFYNGFQVLCNFTIVTYVSKSVLDVKTERNLMKGKKKLWSHFFKVLYEIISRKYELNFFCEELDFTNTFIGTRSAQMSYCYYLIKLLDLLDTVFFVLRKRTRQISFLHVYHHVAILLASFVGVSWAPGIYEFWIHFYMMISFWFLSETLNC